MKATVPLHLESSPLPKALDYYAFLQYVSVVTCCSTRSSSITRHGDVIILSSSSFNQSEFMEIGPKRKSVQTKEIKQNPKSASETIKSVPTPLPWQMPRRKRRKQVSVAVSDARACMTIKAFSLISSLSPDFVSLCAARINHPQISPTSGIVLVFPNHRGNQWRISLLTSCLSTELDFSHSFTCHNSLADTFLRVI